MSKADSRAVIKAHLQEHIDRTTANLHEAEDYLDEHASEITAGKKQQIEAENARRVESIKGFASKIRHEEHQ